MKPEEISRLVTLGDPRIHPDSERVAFVVTRIDLEVDGYRRLIHVHRDDSHRPFTAGPIDSHPRWSPDGKWLAFLRATDFKKPVAQVAVMAADGGEAKVITNFALGVEAFSWSPDSTRLCAVAKTYREADLSDEERTRRPKRISRFPFRFDGRGWLHDRRRQLWMIDRDGEQKPKRLTSNDYDEIEPVWHPRGTRIAFVTDLDPRQGLVQGSDLVEANLDGEMRKLGERSRLASVGYDEQGRLYAVGFRGVDYPRLDHLHRFENDGFTDLLEGLDRSTPITAPLSRVVLADGAAWFLLEDSGRIELAKLDGDGSIERLLTGDRQVTSFDRAPSGRIVAVVATPTNPGTLVELTTGGERTLAEMGEDLDVLSPQHWRVTPEDHDIDVWAYLPPGTGPHPVLLNIHGGPATQYGFGFFDEFQVYAGAGYAVVACNPRGSSGRGEDFVRAVREDNWGTVDVTDVTAALESALEKFPTLDRERIGIMGGSYGGFMTAWTTAKDHRYRSAVVERALTSFPSFNGTSDIAPSFGSNYLGTEDREYSWSKSPLAWVDEVRTPTLVIHSEEDYRCPIEQGEQYLVALWKNGVEAEMLRFPGEGHELSRSGKPRHRVERFEAILEWHARFLGKAEG
jgi:dipeptidyl aminopeptidase/acylaminoacyl peptidase